MAAPTPLLPQPPHRYAGSTDSTPQLPFTHTGRGLGISAAPLPETKTS
jgi:hypothetical protein